MEVLVVELGGERRSLPYTSVREILPLGHLTPVPTAPPSVCGVVQVRGQVLAVIDLARPPRVARVGAPLVVVELGADGAAALLVDRVGDVEDAAASTARPIDLAAELAALRKEISA